MRYIQPQPEAKLPLRSPSRTLALHARRSFLGRAELLNNLPGTQLVGNPKNRTPNEIAGYAF